MNAPVDRSEDQRCAVITTHSGRDDYGRQQFTAEWDEPDGRHRGQVFYANVGETARSMEAAGYRVTIKDGNNNVVGA